MDERREEGRMRRKEEGSLSMIWATLVVKKRKVTEKKIGRSIFIRDLSVEGSKNQMAS